MVRIPESLKPLLIPIDSVRQYPGNYRNGDIDTIMESIQVNGYMSPIVVQRSTGYIVAGNHRYQAMLGLGQDAIPAVVVDIDDDRAKRYLVADNRTSDVAMNDNALLMDILQELNETEMGLAGSGFDEDAMNRLLLEMSQTDMPDGDGGFGGPAPSGIYQVIIEFDNEADQETAFYDVGDRYPEVRKVNL
jgi:ParB-like chromosome segregation protein Spo0J